MRMNGHSGLVAFIILGVLLGLPAVSRAQLTGDDITPGMACSRKGAVTMTANATGPGAYILTCDNDAPSGKWVATINAAMPTSNAQVANKQYVDQAVASSGGGGGSCQMPSADTVGFDEGGKPFFCRRTNVYTGGSTIATSINEGRKCDEERKCASGLCVAGIGAGQIMPDGTVYVGVFGGRTLYIAPTNQGAARWKDVIGANDIAVDSNDDGLENSNQVPNNATFAAFKLCKDMTFGGHNDWYLPAKNEIAFLFTQLKQGITPEFYQLSSQNYWSSTELNANYSYLTSMATGVVSGNDLKYNSYLVRCMRRE